VGGGGGGVGGGGVCLGVGGGVVGGVWLGVGGCWGGGGWGLLCGVGVIGVSQGCFVFFLFVGFGGGGLGGKSLSRAKHLVASVVTVFYKQGFWSINQAGNAKSPENRMPSDIKKPRTGGGDSTLCSKRCRS